MIFSDKGKRWMCWAAFICNANSGVSRIFMNLLLLSFYLWNPNVYITDNDWIWEWSLQWWSHLSRCENKALKKRRRKKTSQRPVRELNPWPLTGISAATLIEGILTLKSEHMLLGIKTSQE